MTSITWMNSPAFTRNASAVHLLTLKSILGSAKGSGKNSSDSSEGLIRSIKTLKSVGGKISPSTLMFFPGAEIKHAVFSGISKLSSSPGGVSMEKHPIALAFDQSKDLFSNSSFNLAELCVPDSRMS